jgi:peptidoglycan/LPS O-acetylase OafA/YrhL
VTRQRADLLTVQALRGIAALLVVAFHAVNAWSQHVLGKTADEVWPNGSGGVDIFFVISGLVMVISADRVAGAPHAWRLFLRQRIVRIVPLYWIMTTAKVIGVLALPALVRTTRLDPLYVAGSYLFLPVRDWNGEFFPVLPVGWTLTYEMMFYGLVTLSLAMHAPVFAVAGPVLGVFALAGIADGLGGFANTIVAEFLLGVLIGIALKRGTRISSSVAVAMLVFGFAAILAAPVVSGVLRPITWGLPAASIVAGAVTLEQRLAPVIPRWMLDAGDASYSIYLMHLFVIPVIYLGITRTLPADLWLPVVIPASLLGSAGVGRVGFLCIERPLLRWLRRPAVAPTVAVAG